MKGVKLLEFAHVREKCTHKFGAHVSIAGGVSKAVTNAMNIGANSFALFLKSPNRWVSAPIADAEVSQFKQLCQTHGYNPMTDVLPHGSYLINMANPDDEKAEKAYLLFVDDLKACERLGIGLYNFHPGSSLKSDHGEAMAKLARNINRAIEATEFVKIVIENMAGHGALIGLQLLDLKTVIDQIDKKERVGVCVDTCHTFAAGYDIRNAEQYEKFWAEFDEVVGRKYLCGIHLNDSKAPLASNRDLHQNLGLGFLGLEVFRLIANDARLEGIPIVLETPVLKEDKNDSVYGEEIKLLEWMIGKTAEEISEKNEELQKKGAKERAEQLEKFEKKGKRTAKAATTLKRAKTAKTKSPKKTAKKEVDEASETEE